MTKVIFACDESGAKGYADQDEAFDGEVGVFAGLMVPESLLAVAQSDFDAVYQRYKPATGKLHITDLSAANQAAIRDDVYELIRRHQIPCFWYAIHVAGFHHHHVEQQALFERIKSEAQDNQSQPGRFKGGSPRDNPTSLHVALFDGLYAHLVAFLAEREQKNVEIEVRTDQIDNPIVEKFEEVAKKLLGDMSHTKAVTKFDTVEEEVVRGQIRVEAHLPPSLDIDLEVKSLEVCAVDNDNGIVLAADVLANHLNYIFKSREADEKYGPLNYRDAVARHPLEDHLDAFRNWGAGDPVGDRLFQHPKAKLRKRTGVMHTGAK